MIALSSTPCEKMVRYTWCEFQGPSVVSMVEVASKYYLEDNNPNYW